jgi:hypothetical protein
MDPTGGMGLWLLLVAIVIALWIFAPFNWALSVSLVLGGLFVAFILFVLSNARFT